MRTLLAARKEYYDFIVQLARNSQPKEEIPGRVLTGSQMVAS